MWIHILVSDHGKDIFSFFPRLISHQQKFILIRWANEKLFTASATLNNCLLRKWKHLSLQHTLSVLSVYIIVFFLLLSLSRPCVCACMKSARGKFSTIKPQIKLHKMNALRKLMWELLESVDKKNKCASMKLIYLEVSVRSLSKKNMDKQRPPFSVKFLVCFIFTLLKWNQRFLRLLKNGYPKNCRIFSEISSYDTILFLDRKLSGWNTIG